MSESIACPDNTLSSTDRRLVQRQQVSSIMYVKLGEHNGGVILNVSEGGLAVQAAMALMDENLALRFQLSANKWVEAYARVAWLTESKTTAGLHFDELSEEAGAAIREWLAHQTEDFAPRASIEEGNLLDATSDEATEHVESDSPVETDGDSILSTSRHDELTQEPLRNELLPAKERLAAPPPPPHVLPESFIDARLRRYLVDERHRIRLYDLVSGETENLYARLTETNLPANAPVTVEEFLARIHKYQELSAALLSIIATGCFWGGRNLEPIWPKMLERIASVGEACKGKPQWVSLRFYPALLLLYAGGLALVAKSNYSALAGLLLQPKLKGEDGNYCLIERLYASWVIEDERFQNALCATTGCKFPVSGYLYLFLRERLREFIPADTEYSAVFDRLEYLLALVWIDQNPNSTRIDWVPLSGPLGLFASKGLAENSIIEQMNQELSDLGKSCPVLRSGFFGGSPGRLRSTSQRIAAQIQRDQTNPATTKGPASEVKQTIPLAGRTSGT